MNGSKLKVVVALLVGIVLGAALMWGLQQLVFAVRPEIVEGVTTAVNEEGTAIGVQTEPDGPGESYVVAGALWRQAGEPWHTSGPVACLDPLSAGQPVRLGVVDVAPAADAPGRPVVVWVECLGE